MVGRVVPRPNLAVTQTKHRLHRVQSMPTSHSDLCKRPQPRTLFIICRKKKSFDVYPRRPCGHTKKRPKGARRRCLLGNSFKRNWSTNSSARVQTDRTHDVKFMRKNGGTKMYLSFKMIVETPCTQFVGSSSSSTYPCIQVYKCLPQPEGTNALWDACFLAKSLGGLGELHVLVLSHFRNGTVGMDSIGRRNRVLYVTVKLPPPPTIRQSDSEHLVHIERSERLCHADT